MKTETIKIPDIGGGTDVEVIELCVDVGDTVAIEDSLVVLESDKASMEVPSPIAGRVVSLLIAVGDTANEGDELMVLEVAGEAEASTDSVSEAPAEDTAAPVEAEEASAAEEPAAASAESSAEVQDIAVPDIGTDDEVEVIELTVGPGDEVAEGDTLVVLESDKASMEIPAPFAGTIESLNVKEGDKVKSGSPLCRMSGGSAAAPAAPASENKAPEKSVSVEAAAAPPPKAAAAEKPAAVSEPTSPGAEIYAGPAVRRLAREFGIPLDKVTPTGPRGRLSKEDLQNYVKALNKGGTAATVTGGTGIPAVPEVDFSAFGDIESRPLSKMEKLTGANMHRSWLNVPHVTQFDDADITELEAFRQSLKDEAAKLGVKVTPLPFLFKACAYALKRNPAFNASLHANGSDMVEKHYIHIGMAVDTPAGLVVPVLRDVDKKSIIELSGEIVEMAEKAKQRKLRPADMQGGCFSISSLGNIGGTGFTPIVNTPELAILGVSRLAVKPVWDGSEFKPRKMLPLSLSYDHRAINGAAAGRFLTDITTVLAEIRRLVL